VIREKRSASERASRGAGGCIDEGVNGRGRRLPLRQAIGRSAGRHRQIKSNR